METIPTEELPVLVNPNLAETKPEAEGPLTDFMAFCYDDFVSQDGHEICHCRWDSDPTVSNHYHYCLLRSIGKQFDPILSNNNNTFF